MSYIIDCHFCKYRIRDTDEFFALVYKPYLIPSTNVFQKSSYYRLNIALDLIETNLTSRKQDLNQQKEHLFDHHFNSFFHENIGFKNFENKDFFIIKTKNKRFMLWGLFFCSRDIFISEILKDDGFKNFYEIRVVGNEILVNKSIKQFFMEEIDLINW